MKKILAADLFCGAGGASTGFIRACDEVGLDYELLAINHWTTAVKTHALNHPGVRHLCESIERVDPREQVPGGRLHVLLAGPECTHFSTARGGRPVNPQSRASAWHIAKWAQELYIDTILIENVPEFRTWGPVGADGRPLKSKRGETFKAFLGVLKSLGYRVDVKILNAADYGDPTTRQRLFIMARRGKHQIRWPDPTHSKSGTATLFGGRQRWTPARQVIDWSIKGKSIFHRKKPLRPATVARILAGLEKFGGEDLKPFLVVLRNHGAGRSLESPIPTLAANGQHIGLAQPCLVAMEHGGRSLNIDSPLPTITTAKGGAFGIAEPFVISAGGPKCPARPVSEPLGTVLTRDHRGVVETFVLPQHGGGVLRPTTEPLPTVATKGAIGLAEPFLVPFYTERPNERHARSRSVDDPLPTITATGSGKLGVVEPYLTKYNRTATGAYSVDEPIDTLSTRDRYGLVEPFIFANRTHNAPKSLDEPIPSLCTADHIALVQPVINGMALDIHFRMLQPHELAAAMSFPKTYRFTGTREEVVKQIGNSWAGELSKALCKAAVRDFAPATRRRREAVA